MTKKELLEQFKVLQKKQFHSGFQNWWVDFVFHYNDIHNIISILNSGKLYSRNRAKLLGLLQTDIADDDVISHTNAQVYDYARFYFGAKTPTLFHNEGLKPTIEVNHNAHCPVPVFLLFDFVSILSLEDVYFSNGNVGATTPEIYNNIQSLPNLEWNSIYHRDSLFGYEDGVKRHITYCRNAEVLVKDEINIYEHLKWICVRSNADKETLLNLVSNATREIIKDKISIFTQDGLFHNRQLYLSDVQLNKNQIDMKFINKNGKNFKFEVFAKSLFNRQEITSKIDNYSIHSDLYWEINALNINHGIHFILKINDYVIYDNILIDKNEVLV